MGLRVAVLTGVASLFCWFSTSAAAEALKYQFKDKDPIYEVIIRGDLPDSVETHKGQIVYNAKASDGKHITLGYSASLQVQKQNKKPGGFPPMPPFPDMWAGIGQDAPEIVIDPFGEVIRTNRVNDRAQLPFMLGLDWHLLLPPLSEEGEATWKTKNVIAIYDKEPERRGGPRPPWERNNEDRTHRSAREVITYTIQGNEGPLTKVAYKYQLSSEETAGDAPTTSKSGEGQILFDNAAGLVNSLDLRYTIELNSSNVTIKVPVTVTARRLNEEEIAKYKAAQAESRKKAQAAAEEHRANAEAQKKGMIGTIQTAQVGGNGGGPMTRVDAEQRQVIGVRVVMGDWMGRRCIRQLHPLYEKPTDKPADKGTKETVDYLPREGYVVGGMVANGTVKDGLQAVQLIYVRMTAGKLVPTDTYRSAWICTPNYQMPQTVLAGKGEKVIGFFGRQGLNQDAIGLVLKDPKAVEPNEQK